MLAALIRRISPVVLLLCASTAFAQSDERPPLTDSSRIAQSTLSSNREREATETIIVRHTEPAILEDASSNVGGLAITKLSERGERTKANAIHQRATSLRARVNEEHRRFVSVSERDTNLRGRIKDARLSHLKNIINATVIEGAPSGTLSRLRSLGYKVELAVPITTSLAASVPSIGASQVWSESRDSEGNPITGRGVQVGVIDTGIDYTHPDFGACDKTRFLAGSCPRVRGGYDWVGNDQDPTDENLHGTHVASIIGANGTVKGVAPDVSLYALRVLDAWGSGSSANVIRALEWATDPNDDGDFSDHLDVINLSLGSSFGNADTADSIATDNAVAAGIIVVAASGNSGPEAATIGSPGAARQAITVGASLLNGTVADFSSRGPVRSGNTIISKPDLVAPGVSICAALRSGVSRPTCGDDTHTALSGTSMATPHISGVAALLKQARPSISPTEVKTLLKATAKPLRDAIGAILSGYEQGAGVVAALPAVEYALSGKLPPVAALVTGGTVYDDSVPIIGSADGSDFEEYRLSLIAPDGTEQTIATGTSPVRDTQFLSLDIGALPSGDYTLKLVVLADRHEAQTHSGITISHLAISAPSSPREASRGQRVVHGSSDIIDVLGRVNGRGLRDFGLTLCWDFADESGCAPEAVTITPNALGPISQGVLASVNIAKIPVQRRGVYTLRLTANYEQRASESISKEFYLDPMMLRDYAPALRCDQDAPCEDIGQQPLLADINGDGIPETIYSLSRHLHVVDRNGAPLPGWPKATDHSLLTPPSVGDLNGDGALEIVVQGYDYLSSTQVRGAIYAFAADGTPLPGWPSRFDANPSSMRRYVGDFLSVMDIDGDNAAEVLLSPFECLTFNASPCLAWTPPDISAIPENYRMFGGLAVGDLDNDGDKEIVSTLTNWSQWVRTGEEKSIVLVQDSTGTILSSTAVTSLIPTGPIITDVDGDGVKEFATYDRSNVTGRVSVVIRDITGSPLPGWTVHVPNLILGDIAFAASLIAADLDNNGSSEIAFQSDIDTQVVFYTQGQASVRKPPDYRLSGYGTLVAANIDSDAASELLFVSRFYPHSFSSKDTALDPRVGLLALVAINDSLKVEHGFPILVPNSSGYLFPLAIGDIDGDRENEIVHPTNGEIVAFRTGGCSNSAEAWPVERASPHRHASASSVELCSVGSKIFEACALHSDHDLIDDCQDQCPLTRRLRPHPICGCSLDESDPDGDSIPTCADLCPQDPLKREPGICGCSNPEADANQDGLIDCGNVTGSFARPTTKPRIVRKRPRYLKVLVPLTSGASEGSRKVAICLRRRGARARCKTTPNGTAVFKPAPGPYTVYYTWLYSNGSSFKSPSIKTRVIDRDAIRRATVTPRRP